MHVAVLLPLLAKLAAAFVVPPVPDASVLAPPSFDLLSSPSTSPLVRKDELYNNRVLLIRHGEKRRNGKEGLSKAGRKRAQCLRRVLGRHNTHSHNVGLIIAQSYNADNGKRARPYFTVLPLAKDLGLEVHTDCERDDPKCVAKLVADFAKRSDKDVLICWKHSFLHTIAQGLGSRARLTYPDDRFDIMWIMKHRRIISKESEKCRGIDDDRMDGKHDRDLELEPERLGEVEEGEEDDMDLEELDLAELLSMGEEVDAEEIALEREEQWSSGQVPLGL
ncbi:hypothetical protein BCR35DRAFT_310792 [Leucosporidium creatinivorum]|uniref:Histidine phosphatase superfamily n=1 Tax=Leucosporidium creatinivorum TaxID=106004 RepID=A0A1Y2CS96_9BASI|nr:hypothetical protein BCR35DRAFT_310792 [Leucosporidium creatinivorum]